MNDDHVDPAVSEQYRAAANESAPARLDRIVLREAAREAGNGVRGGWLAAWYRPLAFAATLGLSVALLLEFTRIDLIGQPPEDSAGAVVSPFEDAANAEAERLRDIGVPGDSTMPVEVPQMDAGPQTAAGSLLPAVRECSDEQRADPGKWWLCILELEKSGLTEAAEKELQMLLRAYPDFTTPE